MPLVSLRPPADLDGPIKPHLRGWIHAALAPLMLVLGLGLLVWTPTLGLRGAVAIYLLSALLLFGGSAIYHRFYWAPRAAKWLRRADHSHIFLFIAGTYTPLAVGLLEGSQRTVLLVLVWVVAAVGVAFRMLWLGAPKWTYVAMYLAMGWAALWWLPDFWSAGGAAVVVWMVIGGVSYTIGALIYALQRPDPSPQWFGYHEIFHAATGVAALSHFVAITLGIRAATAG